MELREGKAREGGREESGAKGRGIERK